MNKIIDFNYPKELLTVIKKIESLGFKAYLVGGALRDILLDKIPKDYDIATDATPDIIIKNFNKVIETGLKHGTVTIVIDKFDFEVTTFREDGEYQDFRRPKEISFSKDIETDLERRDFTINAFAYNPINNRFIDLFNGLDDLTNSYIRAIGVAEKRFLEDALRMMRAIRFAVVLNFEIDKKTFDAIKKLSENIQYISVERVRIEFEKILLSDYPKRGLDLLKDSGLLKYILPELEKTVGVTQNKYHIYDVYTHILVALQNSEKDLIVRLSVLFHDIAKPDVREVINDKVTFYNHEIVGVEVANNVLRRLKYSNNIIEQVTHLVRNHMFHYQPIWKDTTIKRFIKRVKPEYLEKLLKIREADVSASNLEYEDDTYKELFVRVKQILEDDTNIFTIKELDIDGNDIIKRLKIRPSKKIGEILNYLLEYVIENPNDNKKEILLKEIEKYVYSN